MCLQGAIIDAQTKDLDAVLAEKSAVVNDLQAEREVLRSSQSVRPPGTPPSPKDLQLQKQLEEVEQKLEVGRRGGGAG